MTDHVDLYARQLTAQLSEAVNPTLIRSDVSNLLDRLKSLVDGIDWDSLTRTGARIVLNFVLDEVIPRVVEATPVYLDLIILQVIVPLVKNLLAKLDPQPA